MTALIIRNLSYYHGTKKVLDDLTFTVEHGWFCALLGPNGAGKSTLFSLLTRLLVTDQGIITIAGRDVIKTPRAALAHVGVVFQSPTLDLDVTVRRNMRYFAALHGLSGKRAEARIDESLDRLSMRDRAGEKVRTLNGGHRRRMEIARALVHDPKLLLLDEPTVGLDVATRRAITDHVHDLADDGLAVLWATHLVDEVRNEDPAVILHGGKMLDCGTANSIRGDKPLPDVYLAMTAEPA